jgi:hypothetical protein
MPTADGVPPALADDSPAAFVFCLGPVGPSPLKNVPSATSAESCIRKAVSERGLTPGPVGLADTTAEDEAATGTAFALCRLNRWVRGASWQGCRPVAK